MKVLGQILTGYHGLQPGMDHMSIYRLTHQVVTNLPLSSKQKFRFGLACPGLSTGGSSQPDVSPCTISHSSSLAKRLREDREVRSGVLGKHSTNNDVSVGNDVPLIGNNWRHSSAVVKSSPLHHPVPCTSVRVRSSVECDPCPTGENCAGGSRRCRPPGTVASSRVSGDRNRSRSRNILQGDPSGLSKPIVDIDLKVAF